MKKGTKIVIGVAITVLLIIGLVVGGLVGFFFLMVHSDQEYFRKNKEAEVEGRDFGKTTDQNGCMEKGFTIPDKGYKGFEISTYRFIGECLNSSRPTPDFCEGVPLSGDFSDESKWKDEQCKKVGHNSASCIIAFNEKHSFCKRSNEFKSK